MTDEIKLKIEHNIPIPPARGKGFTAALHLLKMGDSVVIPANVSIVCTLVTQIGLNGKVTCRTVKGGTRVWRIK